MPNVEIEILRTVTRDETAVIELPVSQRILDDPDRLFEWVEEQMKKPGSAVRKLADKAWDVHDETIEYVEVNDISS